MLEEERLERNREEGVRVRKREKGSERKRKGEKV